MAEENLQEGSEIVVERTPDEQRAMEHGWVPKEEWSGNPDEWIPANVFNMRGEFFSRISKDKTKIAELTQTVDALVEHNKKIFDAAYKKAIDDLKREKKQALEEGDNQAVLDIDDKIEELREDTEKQKKELEERVQTARQQQSNPVFDSWHAHNSWYMQDSVATAYANEVASDINRAAQVAGVQPDYNKLLSEVGRKVRQKFPEKFGRTSTKTDPVEPGGETTTPTRSTNSRISGISRNDLTEAERRIMDTILKTTPKMTEKEYLEQYNTYAKRKG